MKDTFEIEAVEMRVEFFWHELWGWVTGHCHFGGVGDGVGISCDQGL